MNGKYTRLAPVAVEMLMGLPQKQAGWLIQNGLRFIRDGALPKNVPKECTGIWLAFKREAADCGRLHNVRAMAGRMGGRETQKRARRAVRMKTPPLFREPLYCPCSGGAAKGA